MVHKGQLFVRTYLLARTLPNFRLNLLGVKEYLERQLCWLVDYIFNGINL